MAPKLAAAGGAKQKQPTRNKNPRKRNAAPELDEVELAEKMRALPMQCFILKRYAKINRTQAACGFGLLELQVVLNVIFTVQPVAMLNLSMLMPFFQDLVMKNADILQHYVGFTAETWPLYISERFVTVLAHCRRLRYQDKKLEEAMKKLPEGSAKQLQLLISQVSLLGVSSPKTAAKSAGGSPKVSSPQEPDKLTSVRRKLVKLDSDVSVDSKGFPNILSTPKGKSRERCESVSASFLSKTIAHMQKERDVVRKALQASSVQVEEEEESVDTGASGSQDPPLGSVMAAAIRVMIQKISKKDAGEEREPPREKEVQRPKERRISKGQKRKAAEVSLGEAEKIEAAEADEAEKSGEAAEVVREPKLNLWSRLEQEIEASDDRSTQLYDDTAAMDLDEFLAREGAPMSPVTPGPEQEQAAVEAAAAAEPSVEAVEQNVDGPPAAPSYRLENYRKVSCVGFRQKFGAKAQVFSYTRRDLSEEELKKLGQEAIDKLDAGESLDAVKEWLNAKKP